MEELATECGKIANSTISEHFLNWFRSSQKFENLLRIKLTQHTQVLMAESDNGDKHIILKDFENLGNHITKNCSGLPIIRMDQFWIRNTSDSTTLGVTVRAGALMVWPAPAVQMGPGFSFATSSS